MGAHPEHKLLSSADPLNTLFQMDVRAEVMLLAWYPEESLPAILWWAPNLTPWCLILGVLRSSTT